MRVRVTQLDGSLPNLALMKISAFHKSKGDKVHFTFCPHRGFLEAQYDRVYGSCIFKFNKARADEMREEFPGCVIGGSGVENYDLIKLGARQQTLVEDVIDAGFDGLDYSLYPNFKASIGFSQRGCRLSCGFCIVPRKEGKNRATKTISEIWRGDPFPKHIHLLDNDFFGQPSEIVSAKCDEIISKKFKVCFSQGINVRLITPFACEALSKIKYSDTSFTKRRLYTAWDNLRDEAIFFRGVSMLNEHGVPPNHLMAYMLIGYDPTETWERIWYRFNRMLELKIKPYPMVFDRNRKDHTCFQRWVNGKFYEFVKWSEFHCTNKSDFRCDHSEGLQVAI